MKQKDLCYMPDLPTLWSKVRLALDSENESEAKVRVKAVTKTLAPQVAFMESPSVAAPVSWVYFVVGFFAVLALLVVLGKRFGFLGQIDWSAALSSYSISALVKRMRVWAGVKGLEGQSRLITQRQVRALQRRQVDIEAKAKTVGVERKAFWKRYTENIGAQFLQQAGRGVKLAALATASGTVLNVLTVLPNSVRQQLFESLIVIGVLYVAKFIVEVYYWYTSDLDPIWIRAPQYVFQTYYEFMTRRAHDLKDEDSPQLAKARRELQAAKEFRMVLEESRHLGIDFKDFQILLRRKNKSETLRILKRFIAKSQTTGGYACYVGYQLDKLKSTCKPFFQLKELTSLQESVLSRLALISRSALNCVALLVTIPRQLDRFLNQLPGDIVIVRRQGQAVRVNIRDAPFETNFRPDERRATAVTNEFFRYFHLKDYWTQRRELHVHIEELKKMICKAWTGQNRYVATLASPTEAKGLSESNCTPGGESKDSTARFLAWQEVLQEKLKFVEDFGGPFYSSDNKRFFRLTQSSAFQELARDNVSAMVKWITILGLLSGQTLSLANMVDAVQAEVLPSTVPAKPGGKLYSTLRTFTRNQLKKFSLTYPKSNQWKSMLSDYVVAVFDVLKATEGLWRQGLIDSPSSLAKFGRLNGAILYPFVTNTSLQFFDRTVPA